tara:strand:- start:481 stop:849 length:369 start_codon:yes stop_codon:yes gene_type:complete
MKNIILIGLGGFIGTILRYGIGKIFEKNLNFFPYGTFLINIIGCFILGLLISLLAKENDLFSNKLYLFIGIGFCGGLTTFSTFSMESLNLIYDGKFLLMLLYIISSIGFGLLFCYFGTIFIK